MYTYGKTGFEKFLKKILVCSGNIVSLEQKCSAVGHELCWSSQQRKGTDLLPGQHGSSQDLLSVSLTTSLFSFSLEFCWAGWFWLSRPRWTETLKFLQVDFSSRFLLCEVTSLSMFSALQELFSAWYPSTLSFLGRWIAPRIQILEREGGMS